MSRGNQWYTSYPTNYRFIVMEEYKEMKKIFSFTLAIIMTISILIPYALAENNQKSVDEQENDTFKQKYFSIRTGR